MLFRSHTSSSDGDDLTATVGPQPERAILNGDVCASAATYTAAWPVRRRNSASAAALAGLCWIGGRAAFARHARNPSSKRRFAGRGSPVPIGRGRALLLCVIRHRRRKRDRLPACDKKGDRYGLFTLRTIRYCGSRLQRGAVESAPQRKAKRSNPL